MTDILSEILRAVAGGGYGSSSDGFTSALELQRSLALGNRTMGPTQDMIGRSAGAWVDAMGMNPYGVHGQAAAKLLASAYNFFPDIVGTMIGIPDSSAYYRQIANGSRGIQMAAAGRVGSILNPYSTRMATNQAMDLADMVHGMALGGSGYKVNFTNGLNMDEVGMVAQRVLSSDFMYKGRDGDRLDTASEEFKNKLEKLGAKFNAAASSLAKVTGSVSEALRFMDRMAGGNFLGGTEEQASRIADRARSMSAAIRLTAAMSGTTSREMFGHMSNIQQEMTSRYGVSPDVADASGLYDMMMNPAFMATMAYGTWAANNPKATTTQKNQALMGVRFRASAWAGSSAEDMAAIISYYRKKGLIDQEFVDDAAEKLRRGRSNDVVQGLKDIVGEDVYHEIMSDPSAIMAMRISGDPEANRQLGQAGMEGNLREAAIGGTKRLTRWAMSRSEGKMKQLVGAESISGGTRVERIREAGAFALRRLAKEHGLDWDASENWDSQRLRNFLRDSGADMDKADEEQYKAELKRQKQETEQRVMRGSDLEEANAALMREIDKSSYNSNEKERLKERVRKGEGGSVLEKDLIRRQGLKSREARDIRRRVTGGKGIFSDTAKGIIGDIDSAISEWDHTDEERKWARDSMVNQMVVANEAALQKVIAGEEFSKEGLTDKERMLALKKGADELKGKGLLGDADIGKAESDAYEMLVDEVLEGSIGGLKKDDKAYSALVGRVSKRLKGLVESGKSIDESFKSALDVEKLRYKGIDEGVVGDIARKGAGKLNAKTLAAMMASSLGIQTREGVDEGRIKLDEDRLKKLENAKHQIRNAAFGARGADNVLLAKIATAFEQSGGTFNLDEMLRENGKDRKWLESFGLADMFDELQRSDAERRQNAIGNALGLGEGTHAKAAIETSQQQMAKLGEALKSIGLEEKDLEAVLEGGGTEEQKDKLDSALSNAGFGNEDMKAYGKALLRSFHKNMNVEGGGLGALYGGKLDELKGEKYNEKWAEVTKSAAAEKSPELQIVELLSQVVAFLGMMFKNPMRVAMNGIGGITG